MNLNNGSAKLQEIKFNELKSRLKVLLTGILICYLEKTSVAKVCYWVKKLRLGPDT